MQTAGKLSKKCLKLSRKIFEKKTLFNNLYELSSPCMIYFPCMILFQHQKETSRFPSVQQVFAPVKCFHSSD